VDGGDRREAVIGRRCFGEPEAEKGGAHDLGAFGQVAGGAKGAEPHYQLGMVQGMPVGKEEMHGRSTSGAPTWTVRLGFWEEFQQPPYLSTYNL
jgi:hypothetical protein